MHFIIIIIIIDSQTSIHMAPEVLEDSVRGSALSSGNYSDQDPDREIGLLLGGMLTAPTFIGKSPTALMPSCHFVMDIEAG